MFVVSGRVFGHGLVVLYLLHLAQVFTQNERIETLMVYVYVS